jgi:hypothetical protein
MKLADEAQGLGEKEADNILINRNMMLFLMTNMGDLHHY